MKTTGEVQNGWRCRCLIDITINEEMEVFTNSSRAELPRPGSAD